MNNQEAKFILGAYRPDGRDAADPAFAEALDQARRDPELDRWLERERRFDTSVAQKLAALPPPAGLREAILAGSRFSAVRAPRPWWKNPAWLGAAAAALLVTASWLAVSSRARLPDGAELASFALRDLAEDHASHIGHPAGLEAVQSRFASLPAPLAGNLRLNTDELRRHGCRTVNFRGREIFELCVERDGTWFHVYAARRKDFSTRDLAAHGLATSQGKLSSTVWADADMIYAIVTQAGSETLRRLI